MRLEDALDNWLQISIVAKNRSSDRSAKDTVQFFTDMLKEDHGVESLSFEKTKDCYQVTYEQEGTTHTKSYRLDQAELLIQQIQAEPRYNTNE
ncbi:hypothetical protein [Thermoactinomyces sp. DSM 45892]|uniref:hypothetical protein n=1 Tax=Thermoactinomyces sp. DSM 45892 TaxID=1882753 RepID=UPI0008948DAC|nr:hypothetical protein [Thermoactinomyces sp. DSM 45892]SDY61841.1 hypothetical protein SAMN05444416_106135 [Thermoactinomyces sp. DSM 45892]